MDKLLEWLSTGWVGRPLKVLGWISQRNRLAQHQRATSSMSCRTESGRRSGRSWRTARRPRKNAIRAEADSESEESVIEGLSADVQVQERAHRYSTSPSPHQA